MPNGTPSNVIAGPGLLYVAPLGTTLPTNATTTLGTAYKTIGYTEEGSVFTYNVTTEDIVVAEELNAIRTVTTQTKATMAFQMAESTNRNLVLALSGGLLDTSAVGYNAADPIVPVAANAEVRVILVLQTLEGARWVMPKCVQSSTVEISRKKAPNKTLIPVMFTLELPDTGSLFTVYPNSTGKV